MTPVIIYESIVKQMYDSKGNTKKCEEEEVKININFKPKGLKSDSFRAADQMVHGVLDLPEF